jgi:hypothetical protein
MNGIPEVQTCEDAQSVNPITLTVREIRLTRRMVALVDVEDYGKLAEFKWYASNHRGSCYARRSITINGKESKSYMHREVLGLIPGDKQIVDHRNWNKLDNRKSNLRIVDNSINVYNQPLRSDNTTGFRGVYYVRRGTNVYWMAIINFKNKPIFLGYHKSSISAAIAYNKAAVELYENNAFLNFIPER